MGWLDSVKSAAGSAVKGLADGARNLEQGGEKALSDAWKGAVDAARSVANSAIDADKDTSSGLSKGASDLTAGIRRGDRAGGLLAAGADVLHGEAAGVGHLWSGAINGASDLLGGINQGVHDIGAAAQNGYEAGVNDLAAGVGTIAGPDAARAFRSAATAVEEPVKQLVQFQWGVTEGVVEGLGGAVKGIGSLVGGAYQFATDSHFRDGVINAVENGATYVAEHPRDAVAKAGSAIKNLATDVYQGGVEAARRGDLAEYIGKGVGQVGLVVATAVVAPEAEVGGAVGLAADGAGALAKVSRGAEVLGSVSRGTEIADATVNAGSMAARDIKLGAIARGGEGLPAETVARGEPYSFGAGARSDRAVALVDRSAQALGRNDASGLVDKVVYDSAGPSPSFWVDPTTGERTITMDAATFGKTEAGQLIAGTHELVHAEQWEQVLSQSAGNVAAAHSAMFGASDLNYAIREVLTERRALQSVDRLLGGLTPQQVGHSTRYIEFWQNEVVSLGGGRVP